MPLRTYSKSITPPESKHEEIRVRKKRTAVGNIVYFFILVLAVLFIMSIVFRVSKITVEGNSHYTDADIIKAIEIEEGDNLFFYDRFATISRVFAKLPYIEEISVERSLPNKVKISVVECKALAYLVIGDEYWSMDHTCKILGKANTTELSELIAITGIDPGTLMIGETLTTKDGTTQVVEELSEIMDQLQGRGFTFLISKIDFTDHDRISFRLGNSYTVVLGNGSDLEHKIALFESAYSQLLEGDLGIIDVSDAASVHFMSR